VVRKKTKTEVINRFCEVHGDKYDYSRVEYVRTHTSVEIICYKHGSFWQKPAHHKQGYGCPVCGGERRKVACRSNSERFIESARAVHGDFYGYDKVEYVNCETPVVITCPVHGSFWQTPHSHKEGCGCTFCGNEQKIGLGTYDRGWAARNPRKAQELGQLYLLDLWDNQERFLKIGVTSRSVNQRFTSNYVPYDWRIIATCVGTMADVIGLEAQIAEDNRMVKKWPRKRDWGGWTECYKLGSLDALGEYFPA